MLPLRDTIRSYTFPIVNWVIIAINTLVFILEVNLDPISLDRFVQTFGIVPARLHLDNPVLWITNPLPLFSLFTHMFLHGGWVHFLGNMWVLFIFGDNIEDRMGSLRYLVFYLSGGVVAGLLQAVINPNSTVPAIGASGAIAAVLGGYILLFPKSRVITLIPLVFIPWIIEIPAIIFLGIWFVTQLFSGLLSLGMPDSVSMGGVAWFAHIGG
ncbi:MAG: rhomboid family intramembrane serine protease, partial [Anaerolineales bacterium]